MLVQKNHLEPICSLASLKLENSFLRSQSTTTTRQKAAIYHEHKSEQTKNLLLQLFLGALYTPDTLKHNYSDEASNSKKQKQTNIQTPYKQSERQFFFHKTSIHFNSLIWNDMVWNELSYHFPSKCNIESKLRKPRYSDKKSDLPYPNNNFGRTMMYNGPL